MKKVNKNLPVPMYYQLKELIKEMIENEELKPNDPIPPERELCEYHDISRMTVNKAIMTLVNEGYLYREQGRGTFVAKPKTNYQVTGLSSLTEEMMVRRGLKVDTEVIDFELKTPSRTIKNYLELNDGERVFEIARLRRVEGEAYAIETSYIPEDLCPNLTREKLQNTSLYSVLTGEFNLDMEYANQSIEPIIVDEYEGELLGVEINSLGLLFTRRTYSSSNRPVEVTKSIYRSDKYKFEITLKR